MPQLLLQPGLGEHGDALSYRLARPVWEAHGITAAPLPRSARWSDLVSNLSRAVEAAPAPVFILGVSLGSIVALDALLAGRLARAAGLITIGAPLGETGVPAILISLGRLVGRVAPSLVVPTRIDLEGISRDEALRREYVADPEFKTSAPAGFMRDFLDAVGRVRAGAGAMRVPLLMLHGGEDRIARPEPEFFARVGSPDKTWRLVPGARHNLLIEREREAVVAEIAAWILR